MTKSYECREDHTVCLQYVCVCVYVCVCQVCEITEELDTLPMRALLAAAFITYLSAAPEDHRRHCLETWLHSSGLHSRTPTHRPHTHTHPHVHALTPLNGCCVCVCFRV